MNTANTVFVVSKEAMKVHHKGIMNRMAECEFGNGEASKIASEGIAFAMLFLKPCMIMM